MRTKLQRLFLLVVHEKVRDVIREDFPVVVIRDQNGIAVWIGRRSIDVAKGIRVEKARKLAIAGERYELQNANGSARRRRAGNGDLTTDDRRGPERIRDRDSVWKSTGRCRCACDFSRTGV